MSEPNDAQLTAWAAFAERLADEARAMFTPHIGGAPGVEVKADRSLVTALDRAIEVRLRELIEAAHPTHGVIGEELGATRAEADAVWVLDPIDGTAPFIAGVPVFGTLIALLWRGTPVIGVMDFPVTRDRWVGVQGRPTLHQGQPVRTRRCDALADAMLSTSNPDYYPAIERRPSRRCARARAGASTGAAVWPMACWPAAAPTWPWTPASSCGTGRRSCPCCRALAA